MAAVIQALLTALRQPPGCCKTVAEAAVICAREPRWACRKLALLERRGLAERVKPGCYRLTALGETAYKAGAAKAPAPRPRKPRPLGLRDKLWTAMRRLKKFTIADLLEIAATGKERGARNNAQVYLDKLERADYVRRLARPSPYGAVRRILARDTGPKAPTWRRRAGELIDPNTGARVAVARAKP